MTLGRAGAYSSPIATRHRLWLSFVVGAVATLAAAATAGAAPKTVAVELVVSAGRAVWQPKAGPLNGTLTLRDVSPRMAVLAVAPARQAAVLPAGTLAETWARLVPRSRASATKGKRITNAVVAFGTGADRRLVPVQLELVGSYRDGSRLAFRLRPLPQRTHRVDTLGSKKRTLEDVTILVDPAITDAIKALWNALLDWTWSKAHDVPPNPISGSGVPDETEFDGYFPGSADPDSQENAITNAFDRDNVFRSNQEAAGYPGSATIDRLAVFGIAPTGILDVGRWTFGLSSGTQEVTNSAFFEVSFTLNANGVEFGGINLRGSEIAGGTIQNSLFSGVDMTGFSFNGQDDARVAIRGSVFEDVRTDVNPARDGATDRLGGPFSVANADFTAVSFQDAKLAGATIDSGTFNACSFATVDLSGATVTGDDAAPGGRFQPTFDGSIFAGTILENSRFENVSFAGVDFSGGGVSLDGATLKNVDFTGAVGLQFVDWTTVKLEGNVYGLAEVAPQLAGQLQAHPEYLRSLTFDGEIPAIDPDSGFDVQPGTALLIDPSSGVRLERNAQGTFVPVDAETGEPLVDQRGDPLIWTESRGLTDLAGQPWAVDYDTGDPIGPE